MRCTESNGVGWPVGHRQRLVAQADKQIEQARRMTACANADGELPDGLWYECWQHLNAADNGYRSAGLGLLAGRVAFMARRVAEYRERENFHVAWARFDRLNAGGRCPT